jgi:hypothetical protein
MHINQSRSSVSTQNAKEKRRQSQITTTSDRVDANINHTTEAKEAKGDFLQSLNSTETFFGKHEMHFSVLSHRDDGQKKHRDLFSLARCYSTRSRL